MYECLSVDVCLSCYNSPFSENVSKLVSVFLSVCIYVHACDSECMHNYRHIRKQIRACCMHGHGSVFVCVYVSIHVTADASMHN